MTNEQMDEFCKDVAEEAERRWKEYSVRKKFWDKINRLANPSNPPDDVRNHDLSPLSIRIYSWARCVAKAYSIVSRTAKWRDIVKDMDEIG